MIFTRHRRSVVNGLLWLLLAAFPAQSQDQTPVADHVGTIHISADRLVVPGGTENYAEFIGHVHAVGERFDIVADQLKIFYQPAGLKTGGDMPAGDSLSKIIATGNVIITAGEKIAKTEQAVYDKKDQTILLTGEHSMVQQPNGYISGDRILMRTDSETVTVESGDGKRVEAFIRAPDEEQSD